MTSLAAEETALDQPRSIAHMFLERVAATPDAPAYRYPEGDNWVELTWSQTADKVRDLAAGLVALGVQPQGRISLASSTRIEWVLVDLAAMWAGAATTTIYPTSTQDDVRFIVNDSESSVVFAENDTLVQLLLEGRDAVPGVSKVVTFDGTSDADWVISLNGLSTLGADYLAEHPEALDERLEQITPDALATLIYTSGTTGRPKGVLLPHSCWTYESCAVDELGILTKDDVQYLWLPLAHVFGKMLLSLAVRIGMETAVDGRPDKIVENLSVIRPTWMGAAPRIFEKVYGKVSTTVDSAGGVKAKLFHWASDNARKVSAAREDGGKVPPLLAAQHAIGDKLVLSNIRTLLGGRVRFFISGSAALNTDVARWFDGLGVPILEGYGLTESTAAAGVNLPSSNKIGTVGPPLPGTTYRIAQDGEVLIKGGGVMAGYKDLPDATAEVLVDGWLHTGDIGELLPSGHLKITDRKKDLFKTSNGKYVAPGALEARFKGLCPYVSQLVVEGESRKFVSALITLDDEAIMEWASSQGVPGDYRDVVMSKQTHDMVQGYVDKLNLDLGRWEQIKRFIILPRDLSVEEGEITPSLKLKRKVVIDKYKDQLDSLYTD